MVNEKHYTGDRVVSRVVESVASERGMHPTDLEGPLHDAVDTDALQRICTAAETRDSMDGEVRFEWNDCLVVVDLSGAVTARSLSDATNAVPGS